MANTQPTRIYVSAMETRIEGQLTFDPLAADLLAKLESAGYWVQWVKQHRGYEIIEQDIAASDALLAIVDSTWSSSTWMISEVTWAAGLMGAIKTLNPKMKPIPIFLYPVSERIGPHLVSDVCPFNLVEHMQYVRLERDPDKALRQMRDLLPPRLEVPGR